jgi:predicted transposase
MQQIITAKLKLLTTPEQRLLLRQTQLAYRDALNFVSRYAFDHGKLSNVERLQHGTYRDIRVLFHLPSQMACNVPRQVAATYKGLWTKLKQNLAHRKAGHTNKRYKGLDKPPRYVSPTLTYNYGYDYTFKTGQQVSVLTLDGRIVPPLPGLRPTCDPYPRGRNHWRSEALVRQSPQAVLLVGLPRTEHPRPDA